MDHIAIYNAHISRPYGKTYAAAVGRFQEGFLSDRVCSDLGSAFERAVETAEKLVPAIRLRGDA